MDLCCGNHAYSTVNTNENEEPLLKTNNSSSRSSSSTYPGFLRTTMQPDVETSSKTFIKTGGNALQAVDRRILEVPNTVAVSVPENMKPGQMLMVQTLDGRMVTATIPDECLPGHTFLVRIDSPLEQSEKIVDGTGAGTTVIVQGQDHNDLHLSEDEKQSEETGKLPQQLGEQSAEDPELILVKIPSGSKEGDKIQVKSPDGRVVEATVPGGNISEFYVRMPQSQNGTTVATPQVLPDFV